MMDEVNDPARVAYRNLPRDLRQDMTAVWAKAAFGEAETTSVPQRGLRLLEEAIEAFQACGGDEAMAHKLVAFVFARPPGTVGQELGGVAVTVLLLAAAAGLSADEEECREVQRVLSKPVRDFTDRNANKNAAGFKIP
jgi:NTP pyrophosphatase (non-canonical NTP hydrolase)